MRKIISLLILTVATLLFMQQCTVKDSNAVSVIPEPVSISQKPGNIQLSDQSTISLSSIAHSHIMLHLLNNLSYMTDIMIVPTDKDATIKLQINPELADSLGDEGYVLKSTKKEIQ